MNQIAYSTTNIISFEIVKKRLIIVILRHSLLSFEQVLLSFVDTQA